MNRKAFTLLEIMIVVAIIGTLAAITIPNLIRARIAANETAVITNLRTFATAMKNWRAAHNGDYAGAALNSFSTAALPYINKVLGGGTKMDTLLQSILIRLLIGRVIAYNCTATSLVYPDTGERSFIVDESAVMWGADKAGVAMADADKINVNALE